MAEVTWLVTNYIQERMTNSSTGFNYWLGQVYGSGNYPQASLAAAGLQGLIFTSGQNLFTSDASFDDLQGIGCGTYPMCKVYAAKGNNQPLVTPSEWSGPVISIIELALLYKNPIVPADSESPKSAVMDAILATFNAQEYYDLLSGTNVIYNNEVAFEFEKPIKLDTGWRSIFYFSLIHRVITGPNG